MGLAGESVSRHTTHSTATVACTPCGYLTKRLIDLDEAAPACPTCGESCTVTIAGLRRSNIFPYTTTHLDGTGREVTISSIIDLRNKEREIGFVAPAFSQNHSNWDYPLTQAPVRRDR